MKPLFVLPLLSLLVWSACRTPGSSGVADEGAGTPRPEDALRSRLAQLEMTTPCPEGKVCATFLQINDVYEIDAVDGGKSGGLDRLATLRRLLAENPAAGPVLFVLAGDFFNPSGLGTIKENGRAWAGRQMISTLKAAGLDLAIFGNHEFDLNRNDFQARLDESGTVANPDRDQCQSEGQGPASGLGLRGTVAELASGRDGLLWEQTEAEGRQVARWRRPRALQPHEVQCIGSGCRAGVGANLVAATSPCAPEVIAPSREGPACFQWVASNVFRREPPPAGGEPTPQAVDLPWTTAGHPIPKALILSMGDPSRAFRLGLIGLTVTKNGKDYMQFGEIALTARQLVGSLRAGASGQPAVDALVAITHLDRADDVALLRQEPGIDLIIGGHDHKQSLDCVGEAPRRCAAKADANARSVYLHRLVFDPKAKDAPQRLAIRSERFVIDERIPRDPKVTALIQCFFRRADTALAGRAISLKTTVARIPSVALDGTGEAVRRPGGSALTDLYARAMLDSARGAPASGRLYQLALINGGTFRIDDLVGPGEVTYYDAVRVLPFENKLATTEIRISDLAKILHRSWNLPVGSGNILHVHPRLALVDRPLAEITVEGIAEEIRQKVGASSTHATVGVVTNEYMLTSTEGFSPEERSWFSMRNDQVRQANMRELLVEALRGAYPP